WRAALAIPVGLFLQAALFSHGGFTTLGVNSCVMVLPALFAWQLFSLLHRVPWVRQPWFRSALVFLTTTMWMLSLIYGVLLLLAQSRLSWLADRTFHAFPIIVAVVFLIGLATAWLERRLDHAP